MDVVRLNTAYVCDSPARGPVLFLTESVAEAQ
jgi:hypothetical protein